MNKQQFASDNYAGVCPTAWKAMQDANQGSAVAYGDDHWTELASDALRDLFKKEVDVFFVFNGTAANSLALAALCQSYQSVICAASAHIETDECGAPEFFSSGSKLLAVSSQDGKLTPSAIRRQALSRTDIHFPRPRAVTITQPTENGLVYSIEEIKAISAVCKELGLYLHMDGSRFAHACATLGCEPADLSWKAGVDVLCFGGTKGGMAIGEAVIFFDQKLSLDFGYRCKQAGQLASKMRFLAAPWIGILKDNIWLKNAQHGNQMAQFVASQIRDLSKIKLMFSVQSNAVFLSAPQDVLDGLRARGWAFYTFIGDGARFMFAWDAEQERVQELVDDLRELDQ